jgi:thioredoxin-like negative regulator of GroEL
MKKLIVLLAVIVVAYLVWAHFRAPALAGKEVAEDARVTFVTAQARMSIADSLDEGSWTLILFPAPSSEDSKALETRLEVAVRQKVSTVRLVVIDVGSIGTAAADGFDLKKLPTAWLFDGVAKKSDDIQEILKMLGA